MDLRYNLAFHSQSEIEFVTGERVVLHALHQWLTYGAWLEGSPSREWNDRIIAGDMRRAETYCPEKAKPVLIPPERRPYLREPEENTRNREFMRKESEWLPMLTCVGVFQGAPARDKTKHMGILTVIWYQSEYAPPIEAVSAEQLRNLSWVNLATDVEY
jgi:hypothetical protein